MRQMLTEIPDQENRNQLGWGEEVVQMGDSTQEKPNVFDNPAVRRSGIAES